MASISDVLPAPFGPIRPVTVPGFEPVAHVVDGDDRAVAHRQVLDRQRPRRDARWWSALAAGSATSASSIVYGRPHLRVFLM